MHATAPLTLHVKYAGNTNFSGVAGTILAIHGDLKSRQLMSRGLTRRPVDRVYWISVDCCVSLYLDVRRFILIQKGSKPV